MNKIKWSIAIFLILATTVTGILIAPQSPPSHRKITIHAKRYEYKPPIIRVNKGDKLTITLISEDVEHGFYLEGYGIDESIKKLPPDEEPKVINFTVNKAGKFRYRCSNTCGYLHPFMQGELIVQPNRVYYGGLGLITGILLGAGVLVLYEVRKQ